jgi:hypothetical protein
MKNLARRALYSPVVRRIVGPYLRPIHGLVMRWVHVSIDPRLELLERHATEARLKLEGLERYVPIILSSIQAQNAASRAATRTHNELVQLVNDLLERSQRLHDDTLDKLGRAGLAPRRPDVEVEAKVLNPDKVNAASGRLRLDLGAGHAGRPDHVHVGTKDLDNVDVVGDVRDLPFPPGSVAEIVSEHLVPSFSPAELAETILPHWSSRLAPGGTLVAVVADLDALVRAYVAGGVGLADLQRTIFADPDGQPRVSAVSAVELGQWFAKVGLVEVTVAPLDGHPYDVAVSGRKPPAVAR